MCVCVCVCCSAARSMAIWPAKCNSRWRHAAIRGGARRHLVFGNSARDGDLSALKLNTVHLRVHVQVCRHVDSALKTRK